MTDNTNFTLSKEAEASVTAKALADLVDTVMSGELAAAVKQADEEAEEIAKGLQDENQGVRIRAAIRDYQLRSAYGAWPSFANREAVRKIAQTANAPRDVVRFVLQKPYCFLGQPRDHG